MLSYRQVEQKLIEAGELWIRTPSSGFGPGRASPFASDGPWHLLTRQARAGDLWEAWRVEIEDMAVQAARDKGAFAASEGMLARGLDRLEVKHRDQVSDWLSLVPEEDRLLVAAAVWWRARTGRRVDWSRMLRLMGLSRGKEGLRKRYCRALAQLGLELERRQLAKAA